jgi:hypothetical protein
MSLAKMDQQCFICHAAKALFVCRNCQSVAYCSHACQLEEWASDGAVGYHNVSPSHVGCPIVGDTLPSSITPARVSRWIATFNAMVGNRNLSEARVAAAFNKVLRSIEPRLPRITVRFAEKAPLNSVCRKPPFTASTDGNSWLCIHPRIRDQGRFQRQQPPAPIAMPRDGSVSHFAVVMLHEVAHILHTQPVTQYIFLPLWQRYQLKTRAKIPTLAGKRQFAELMANCFVQALIRQHLQSTDQ